MASLLVAAGQQWVFADQPERALECYRRAVAAGGDSSPDARCYLLGHLLEHGSRAEADALAADLKAERPSEPAAYEYVGEMYERAGDLATATSWFTTGMLRAMRDDETPEFEVAYLMQGRWRVRRAQGFPPDDYDELVLDTVTPTSR